MAFVATWGCAALAAAWPVWTSTGPNRAVWTLNNPEAPGLLCYIAQWVDAGWRDVDVVQDGLGGFPKGRRIRLSLLDYAYVLMAEGMIWVAEENVERALANFSLVLSLRAEIADPVVLALAHFWSSRCNRKAGEYDTALNHAAEGYRYATEAGMEPMAAAMRVAESWLLFQKGRLKDALKLLGEADAVLRETDDFITRGNIQSSYGRMYRREGRYDLALRHFSQAIEEYGKRDPEHRNLARSLANMGYVERLIALAVAQAHRRRRRAAPAQRAGPAPRLREHPRPGSGPSRPRGRDLSRSTPITAAPGRSASIAATCISTAAICTRPTTKPASLQARRREERLHPDGPRPPAGMHGREHQARGGD